MTNKIIVDPILRLKPTEDSTANPISDFIIEIGINKIGRATSNNVFLDDVTVSNYHASLNYTGAIFKLKDLNSLNKTLLQKPNEAVVELKPNTDYIVTNGSKITFGSSTMILNYVEVNTNNYSNDTIDIETSFSYADTRYVPPLPRQQPLPQQQQQPPPQPQHLQKQITQTPKRELPKIETVSPIKQPIAVFAPKLPRFSLSKTAVNNTSTTTTTTTTTNSSNNTSTTANKRKCQDNNKEPQDLDATIDLKKIKPNKEEEAAVIKVKVKLEEKQVVNNKTATAAVAVAKIKVKEEEVEEVEEDYEEYEIQSSPSQEKDNFTATLTN